MLFIKRKNIKAKKTINIRQISFECISRMFEQKKRIKSFKIIPFVHLDIPFSNSFYQNISDIYKLKELLYNEGIADHNGLPLVKPESSTNLILP